MLMLLDSKNCRLQKDKTRYQINHQIDQKKIQEGRYLKFNIIKNSTELPQLMEFKNYIYKKYFSYFLTVFITNNNVQQNVHFVHSVHLDSTILQNSKTYQYTQLYQVKPVYVILNDCFALFKHFEDSLNTSSSLHLPLTRSIFTHYIVINYPKHVTFIQTRAILKFSNNFQYKFNGSLCKSICHLLVSIASQSLFTRSAPFSPIIITGAFVFPLQMVGMMDASITLNPATP